MKRILLSLLTLTTLTASVLPAKADPLYLHNRPDTFTAQYHREPHFVCHWNRYEHREVCFRHFD